MSGMIMLHARATRVDGRDAFQPTRSQAYQWLQPQLQLPVVREWGRWEGKDRRGESLEVDIASTHLQTDAF